MAEYLYTYMFMYMPKKEEIINSPKDMDVLGVICLFAKIASLTSRL